MKIKKIEIDNEIVYLKKNSTFGWKVVSPIKKDIDKPFTKDNINWFNLWTGGSWWNLLIVAIIVLIIVGFAFEYTSNLKLLNECLQKPMEIIIP